MLGGYDKSRTQGSFFETAIKSERALLQVEIKSIFFGQRDFLNSTSAKDRTITAVLDDSIDQLVFPSWIVKMYSNMIMAQNYPGIPLRDFNQPISRAVPNYNFDFATMLEDITKSNTKIRRHEDGNNDDDDDFDVDE